MGFYFIVGSALIVNFVFSFARTRSLSTKDVFQILLRSFHSAHCLILEQVLEFTVKPLRIEQGGAVANRDLVTVLGLALMQYITKLAMTQIQKPPVPLPPKYKVMCTVDAVSDSFFCTQNSVDRPLVRIHSPVRSLLTYIIFSSTHIGFP
jgi:hypothetical protein